MHLSKFMMMSCVIGMTISVHTVKADLAVTSWQLSTTARVALDPVVSAHSFAVTNPFNTSQIAAPVQSRAETKYNFDWNASGGTFDFDIDHKRSTNAKSHAQTTAPHMLLQITNQDMHYDISGAYALVGDRTFNAVVTLRDITNSVDIFHWRQLSLNSPNDSFAVGRAGDGDFLDQLTGSPTGTLLAGNTYNLTYNFVIATGNTSSAQTATALGNFSMKISAIPAPGAALLAMLGFSMVGWFRRRAI